MLGFYHLLDTLVMMGLTICEGYYYAFVRFRLIKLFLLTPRVRRNGDPLCNFESLAYIHTIPILLTHTYLILVSYSQHGCFSRHLVISRVHVFPAQWMARPGMTCKPEVGANQAS